MQPHQPFEPDPVLAESDRLTRLERHITHLEGRLSHLEQRAARLARVFHPAAGLAAGLLCAGLLALAVVFLFDGSQEWFYLYYFVPMAVPFVVFLFDRVRAYTYPRRLLWALLAVDFVVLAFALARSFYPVPFISGHALFLGFALLTVSTTWERVVVILVLSQVIVLKVFAWHTRAAVSPTLYGGLIAGSLAALVWHALRRR